MGVVPALTTCLVPVIRQRRHCEVAMTLHGLSTSPNGFIPSCRLPTNGLCRSSLTCTGTFERKASKARGVCSSAPRSAPPMAAGVMAHNILSLINALQGDHRLWLRHGTAGGDGGGFRGLGKVGVRGLGMRAVCWGGRLVRSVLGLAWMPSVVTGITLERASCRPRLQFKAPARLGCFGMDVRTVLRQR